MWCVTSKSVVNGLFALFCGIHEHTPCIILIKYVKGKVTSACYKCDTNVSLVDDYSGGYLPHKDV